LRTADHRALNAVAEAAANGSKVAAVFVFDEEDFKLWAPSFARYVWTSVKELSKKFEEMGGELVIQVGSAKTIIPALAAQMGAAEVLTKEELEWGNYHRIKQVEASLQEQGVKLRSWTDEMRPWGGDLLEFPSDKTKYNGPDKGKPVPVSAVPPPPEGSTAGPLAAFKGVGGAGGAPLPDIAEVAQWALGQESADEKAAQEAERLREVLMRPEAVRARENLDDTFVTARQSLGRNMAAGGGKDLEELPEEPPEVPFRLPGGESAALEFYTDAWLNFYIATNNSAYQQMQQRIQVDKNTAFYYVFRNALAAGCLTPRQVWAATRQNEIESYRVTDLGTMATRIVEQRDFEAHMARRDLLCGKEGPGWPCIGYYNVSTRGQI